MPDSITKLNFSYNNIQAISEKQFDVHQSLYEGYVKKINEIWTKLSTDAERAEANATYSYYRGLKCGETYALDGVILHELYFSNLGGSNHQPDSTSVMHLERGFGSVDNWKKDLIACGMAARGWAILAYDQRSKSLHNFLCDAHDVGGIWTAYPILVLDVYEHAYYIDYPNKKEAYIHAFYDDINWDVVNQRMRMLDKF